ncbi:hypothetical protein D3C72_2521440 [compost metagenome]
MHHLGTPDLMRTTLAQGQQPGTVVDLAVDQNDPADRRVTRFARRLQGRERLDLRADIR